MGRRYHSGMVGTDRQIYAVINNTPILTHIYDTRQLEIDIDTGLVHFPFQQRLVYPYSTVPHAIDFSTLAFHEVQSSRNGNGNRNRNGNGNRTENRNKVIMGSVMRCARKSFETPLIFVRRGKDDDA
jgi:hypothetical protein